MDIEKFEKILERSLTKEEIKRYQKIESELNIRENDALWSIIISLEYQRDFYQKIPENFEEIFKKQKAFSEKILNNFQKIITEQIKIFEQNQSQLNIIKELATTQSVTAQNTVLSLAYKVFLVGITIFVMFFLGTLGVSTGYLLSNKLPLPTTMLSMPVGWVFIIISSILGGTSCYLFSKMFFLKNKKQTTFYGLLSVLFFILTGLIISYL